jgi:hypothetical protein
MYSYPIHFYKTSYGFMSRESLEITTEKEISTVADQLALVEIVKQETGCEEINLFSIVQLGVVEN